MNIDSSGHALAYACALNFACACALNSLACRLGSMHRRSCVRNHPEQEQQLTRGKT